LKKMVILKNGGIGGNNLISRSLMLILYLGLLGQALTV